METTINQYDNNNLKTGFWKEINNSRENGYLDITAKGHYKEGKREGIWQSFTPSGILFAYRNYKNDKKLGLSVHWFYDSSIIESIGNHENGHHRWEQFYENGQRKTIGYYKDSLHINLRQFFNTDGYITKEIVFII